jgi:hypothetical protein
MKKQFLFVLIFFLSISTNAQLEPTRLSKVSLLNIYDNKWINVINDSFQLATKDSSILVYKKFNVVSEIKDPVLSTLTIAANKNSKRNEIFLSTRYRDKLYEDGVAFLFKLSKDYKTLIPIKVSLAFLKANGLGNKFELCYHVFDRENNTIYFSNLKKIIKYAIDKNEFSIFPIEGYGNYCLEWIDKGYLYFTAQDKDNRNIIYLNSISVTQPGSIKKQMQYTNYSHPTFTEIEGQNKMFIRDDNGKHFLIDGNEIKAVEIASLLKMRGWMGSTNNTGDIEIHYLESNKRETINLKYRAQNTLTYKDELVIGYGSSFKARIIEEVKEEISPFENFQSLLLAFNNTKDEWYNLILEYNKCMKEKVYFDCNPLKKDLRLKRLDTKLNEVNYLLNELPKYKINMTYQYGALNYERLKGVLTLLKSDIIRVQKEL